MRNEFVLVGLLAGALVASPAFAQHKAPNSQPGTATTPAAPTGDLPLNQGDDWRNPRVRVVKPAC